jgi:hypothetical protein
MKKDLRTQLAEAKQDLAEEQATRERLAKLLKRTASVLKGEPDELTLHSWHDLPEIAESLQRELEDLANENARYRAAFGPLLVGAEPIKCLSCERFAGENERLQSLLNGIQGFLDAAARVPFAQTVEARAGMPKGFLDAAARGPVTSAASARALSVVVREARVVLGTCDSFARNVEREGLRGALAEVDRLAAAEASGRVKPAGETP